MNHFIILSLFFLVSCGSPQNHKIKEGTTNSKLSETNLQAQILDYQFDVKWLGGPFGNSKQQSKLIVFVYRNSKLSDIESGLHLQFYTSMPSMGHPMAEAGEFVRLSEGVYLNKGIEFNMPGEWMHELWLVDENFDTQDYVVWPESF